VVRGDLKCN
jgi:hypothetical protein